MCTIHKSGTQAINFRLSLRRFWRPLQMRKRTMFNIIKVFPQKLCDSPPKLTMDRLPCHKCVIQGQVLFSATASATREDDVVICSGFIYSKLVPVPDDHVYSQPVTVFSWPFIFTWQEYFEPRPPDITFRYDFLFVIHFSNCLRRAHPHCELTE